SQVDPERALDLEGAARATGGQSQALAGASAFRPAIGGRGEGIRVVPWWPWLFGLSLLGYLGDVYWRRRNPRN
ncbi:MAG: hypothetical protein KDB53_09990, partial [Planctomycetes bacterium]|nr:hypothetical protein [Planctomycetota bacterium]